jgi:uncharacterized membrane protein
MIFDITVWTAVVWMMFMVFALDTSNYRSMFVFKVLPFVISVVLAVAWANERGYLINTGG